MQSSDEAPSSSPVTNKIKTLCVATFGGVALGMGSFLADEIDHPLTRTLLTLVSSTAIWGLVSFLAGYAFHRLRPTLTAAVGVLVTATTTYYALILFVSKRWNLGTSAEGGSAAGSGLLSVGRAFLAWTACSIIAGVMLGLCSHHVKRGNPRSVSALVGATFGLLAGGSAYALTHLSLVTQDSSLPETVFLHLTQVAVVLVGTTVPLLARKAMNWCVFLTAGMLSTILFGMFWQIIRDLRSTI